MLSKRLPARKLRPSLWHGTTLNPHAISSSEKPRFTAGSFCGTVGLWQADHTQIPLWQAKPGFVTCQIANTVRGCDTPKRESVYFLVAILPKMQRCSPHGYHCFLWVKMSHRLSVDLRSFFGLPGAGIPLNRTAHCSALNPRPFGHKETPFRGSGGGRCQPLEVYVQSLFKPLLDRVQYVVL